jgi:hypothetical protein
VGRNEGSCMGDWRSIYRGLAVLRPLMCDAVALLRVAIRDATRQRTWNALTNRVGK